MRRYTYNPAPHTARTMQRLRLARLLAYILAACALYVATGVATYAALRATDHHHMRPALHINYSNH